VAFGWLQIYQYGLVQSFSMGNISAAIKLFSLQINDKSSVKID
jgi:hypothetical protein